MISNISNMTELVKIYPLPVIIQKDIDNNNWVSTVHIQNVTNGYIIFNAYLNKSLIPLYSIYPSRAFILPNNVTEINITRYNKDGPNKIKFVLIFYAVDEQVQTKEEVKEIIKNKKYNEQFKQEVTLEVIVEENKVTKENKIEVLTKKLEFENDNNEKINLLSHINNEYQNKIDSTLMKIEETKLQLEELKKNKESKSQKEKSKKSYL